MPISGSTMARRQLGRRLRQLRREARKTEADVVEAGLASRVKLWRIETGKLGTKIGDVRALCWLYGTDNSTTDALADLAAACNRRDYWEDHHDPHIRSWLYLAIESAADEIRTYAPALVPDLLQTPDYFRGLRLAFDPDATESDLRNRSKLHLERQEMILTRTPPPRLTVVINTGVFASPVGGDEVMADQITRLYGLNRSDCVDIRVLPWEVGAHPAVGVGAFDILDFHSEEDPSVVYAGTLTGARYSEKADEVTDYRRLFRRLYDKTVPIETQPVAARAT